jgi:hypothetical protein
MRLERTAISGASSALLQFQRAQRAVSHGTKGSTLCTLGLSDNQRVSRALWRNPGVRA